MVSWKVTNGSNSTDIHPILEEIKPGDHVISSQVRGRFLEDLVLLLPFEIPKKLSVTEMASCTFYCHVMRSCTRVLYEQK